MSFITSALTFLSILITVSRGASLAEVNVKIVGGNDANITDYPYQVSVQINGRHACGGSIINKVFVLTAAHCTFDQTAETLSIRVGSSYRNQGGRVYAVNELYYHPEFNDGTYDYDISLLRLNSSLEFGTSVRKISLASEGTQITDGLLAQATGWGLLSDPGPPATQLQVVTLPVISRQSCSHYYPAGYVTERMFCAGYENGGKDTCTGDSGGPLVVSGIQIGLTSWGLICAAPDEPGAYANLLHL
ncbi:hypothetical protein JTB14_030270 [Gonioctena quinquepunctata]|nr:hypothetical protein JTB14_030270 [Gonioctena quinquepunctata]